METRILIADDDVHIRSLLANFMDKRGYEADLAENVHGALEFMENKEYDIVLTDKNMPDAEGNLEGGMTVLRYAKNHAPATEVIMITGYATIETAVEAMKLGAFDYIMKPISLRELDEKIERVLEYRQFVNSEDTMKAYRTLHNQLLTVLENREDLPEDRLREIIRTLGARIDNVFGMQKDYETIIQSQADALERIEGYIEGLEEAVSKDSPYYALIEKIREESKKRI
ncbi:MAG: response regulator [Thermodesulfobacteriota bacterium]|nr:response regulator [Thermodesulfobacteriota bacterium]